MCCVFGCAIFVSLNNLTHSRIFIFIILLFISLDVFLSSYKTDLNCLCKKSFNADVFETLLIYSLKTFFCSLERELYFLLNFSTSIVYANVLKSLYLSLG